MEKPMIENLQKVADAGYLPFTDFQEQMKKFVPCPYQANFSFLTLIQKLRTKSDGVQDSPLAQTIARLEAMEEELQKKSGDWEAFRRQKGFESLMIHLFPSFFFEGQMGFIKGPFENHQFRFQTDAFLELLANDRWEVKINTHNFKPPYAQNILMAGAAVLKTFYEQEVDIYTAEGITLRDRQTKIERHFQFNVQLDYMEVKAIKPLKKLSRKMIHELLCNLDDEELWLEYIPPENFLFEGFIIGFISDVTRAEILSVLKEMAANEGGKSGHENDLETMELLARTYLNMPDLRFGVLQTVYGPWVESISWCLLGEYNTPVMESAFRDPQSAYGKVLHSGNALIVEDLKKAEKRSALEDALLEKGIRSLLLAPLTDAEGKIISIFELASPEPYRLNAFILTQMEEFISLTEMGADRFIQEMENAIRLTIQQEFTSIHPSVEWKFRNVASKCFWERIVEERQYSPEPIVFKNVYPLYGQADIVGSSTQRNNSIQTDLIDNLDRLFELLIACRKEVRFHLLDVYGEQVKAHADRLRKGKFVSSDESVIVELLTEQVHPLVRKLSARFPQLPQEMLDEYFSYLDPELDIVYRRRKAYEDSVSLLNQTVSHYLLQEEEKMQEILPHYFEKFQTDGVEYNLYLGQSLLEKGEFHPFYLRDFRLWQLIVMCEITRLVKKSAKNLPIPLTTAQLIFVYNSSLSIRFEMDEKQFDVDGAYNVRYEILKKRIDKAYIKGTDERLTQAGKIAIVWLQEKDRQEYQEYLDHLVKNGYIKPEIEDHELDKMQGVEGLKAIRIEVIVDEE
jgi:hypothetical protein